MQTRNFLDYFLCIVVILALVVGIAHGLQRVLLNVTAQTERGLVEARR